VQETLYTPSPMIPASCSPQQFIPGEDKRYPVAIVYMETLAAPKASNGEIMQAPAAHLLAHSPELAVGVVQQG